MSNNIPSKSLEALVRKLVDYAGLFPPAKLPLDEAYKNFIKYSGSEYKWMLSNFIIPAKKLDELTGLISNSDNTETLHFSVLGSSGENEQEFMENLTSDIHNWKTFLKANAGKAVTNVYEVKLPFTLVCTQNAEKIGKFIESVSDILTTNINKDIILFFEGTPGEEWRFDIEAVIEGIKIHNLNHNNTGYKLRTGGIVASAFPLPEVVAYAIRECLNRQVGMKCTAGLHHPIKHFNNEVNARMHGFLNIFGAGAIAVRHNISEFELIKMLEEEDPGAFEFTDEYFSWDNYKVSIEDIEYSRESLTISFGSCSFDEPIDDLKKLNLL